MKPLVTVFALILALLACGTAGAPYHPPADKAASCANGFINDTKIPTGDPDAPYVANWTAETSTLWVQWRAAQHDLSTQPIYYPYNGSNHYGPPLLEAATEQPNCAQIVSVPELPGGGFECAGQRVGGCVVGGVVYVEESAAWRSQYEIANLILCRYGRCVGR